MPSILESRVSETALLTAAARAVETKRDGALFQDPFAHALAGNLGSELLLKVGADIAVPSIAVRTRFFDDIICSSVAGGTTQVVQLGCGLDARAFRLRLPRDVCWYNVDQEHVLAYRRSIMTNEIPAVTLKEVAGDISDDFPFNTLIMRGLDVSRPILWVLEGVLCFMGEFDVDVLFRRIRRLSASASEIIFDVPSAGCLEGNGQFKKAADVLRSRGLRFACDDPDGLARKYFRRRVVLHEGHPRAHYGRTPREPSLIPPRDWALHFVHAIVGSDDGYQ